MVVFAVEHHEKANGERFLLASAFGPVQSIADIIREKVTYQGFKAVTLKLGLCSSLHFHNICSLAVLLAA